MYGPRRQQVGLAFLASLAAAGLAACQGDNLGNVGSNGRTCPTGETRPMGRCAADTDCCPRESCFVSTGVCFARDECQQDSDCNDPEKVCKDANSDGFKECVYERCDPTDPHACDGKVSCPADKVVACISGGCQCGEPCHGGCPTNQGCCLPTDTCEPLPAQCAGLTCPLGQFASVTSTGAWSVGDCHVVGESCSCEKLPPLAWGDIGLYSALGHDATSPVMSAYNLTYGDLMFGIVGSDGTVAWEFVDGVPSSTSAITGDVEGPRGGNSLKGDDVGLYTDLAIDAHGRPHIAYQDRERGALKYALLERGGWTIHTVDGEGPGDTGLYSSIALSARGEPRIVYLSAREPSGNARFSTLRLAVSSTTSPAARSSWAFRDLVTLDLAGRPCADRCSFGEVCRDSDGACLTPDPAPNACGTRCSSSEACVSGQCTTIRDLPTFVDQPWARGLWPSLAVMPDGGVLVAYYDRVDQNLKVARIRGADLAAGAVQVVAIDGNGVGGSTDDAGQFPSLFVTPGGEIHLAYMNATRHALWYRSLADDLTTLVAEEVESGLGTPAGDLVGADAALVVDRNGTVRIAYQDATTLDLRYAKRTGPNAWALVTLAGNEPTYRGSFGFYTDQTLDQSREHPIVSTYRYFLSAPGGAQNGIETFVAP